MRLVLWGTADTTKPRVRMLRKALHAADVVAAERLFDIWRDVEDKSQVRGIANRLRIVLNFLIAYPVLIWRYMRAPSHDAVFVSYLGHFDVLVLWPFAKLRGARIVWDAFLSLYDTVVEDRQILRRRSLGAGLLYYLEKCACAAADVIILDTSAHAEYFERRYSVTSVKFLTVWVGAEERFFEPVRALEKIEEDSAFTVLFYGQFIPLHGIEHILEAARLTSDPCVRWKIVGRGQESARMKELADTGGIDSVTFVDWIPYEHLPEEIAKADLCLGVFGKSDKAARVIPNKAYQIIAAGRPLVTMESPAIRELLPPGTPCVWLVPAGDGRAIADAVADAVRWRRQAEQVPLFPDIRRKIAPDAIGARFTNELSKRLEGRLSSSVKAIG